VSKAVPDILAGVPWVKVTSPGMYEYPERLMDASGGRHVWQMRENLASLGCNLLDQLFYGDPSERPGEMRGLMARFSSLDPERARCAENVIDAGDADPRGMSSVLLVGWGLESVFMVSPSGKPDAGAAALVVKNWRYVVRIANIGREAKSGIQKLMKQAILHVPQSPPETGAGYPRDIQFRFYMNRMAAQRAVPVQFDPNKPVFGRFCGIPVTVTDALRENEPRVAGKDGGVPRKCAA